MEQAALSYYLYENNYLHTAIPIRTLQGDWFAPLEEKQYMVLKVRQSKKETSESHGRQLAAFHQMGSQYTYEPQRISSYGEWKQLWIDKLSTFEAYAHQEARKSHDRYERLVMDILPYLIGMSENAIQYIAESQLDLRYDDGDQGTITFQRYRGQMMNPVIWPDELTYDHPVRDLAEYMRSGFLSDDQKVHDEMVNFMVDYQHSQPLSLFSWRQLYARLIFPAHLFDYLEKGFFEKTEESYQELEELVAKQPQYEKKLNRLYDEFQVDYRAFDIPVLHWL